MLTPFQARTGGPCAPDGSPHRPRGPDFRGGVVTVRCPACAAEQCPERQQYHTCRGHADTCSAQDVQGIVHPQVHPGPARQDGIPDPRRGERPGQERHERDRDRQRDGGVAGRKARAVRRLLAQHRVGHDLIGPGAVGDGLGHMPQQPGDAGGRGSGHNRQDATVSGQDVDDDQGDDGDDAPRQEQAGQRRQFRGGRRNLVEQPEQALIPPERSGFEQDRRSTEQRCSQDRQKSGRPGPWDPGWPLRPPPRFKRCHRAGPRSGVFRPPHWLTADAVRKPAATIGLMLAFDIARSGLLRRMPPAVQAGAQASWTYELPATTRRSSPGGHPFAGRAVC